MYVAVRRGADGAIYVVSRIEHLQKAGFVHESVGAETFGSCGCRDTLGANEAFWCMFVDARVELRTDATPPHADGQSQTPVR